MFPGILTKRRKVTYYFIIFPDSKMTFLACKVIIVHLKLWGKLCFIVENIFVLLSRMMWYVLLKPVAKYY